MNGLNLETLLQKRTYSDKTRKVARFILLIVWGGFLIFLAWGVWKNWGQIYPLLRQAKYQQLLAAFAYYMGTVITAMLCWLAIIDTFAGSPGWWKNLQIYSATFAARRLPGTIWYIVGRVALLQKLGMNSLSVLLASLIESIVTLCTGGLIGIIIFIWIQFDFSLLISGLILLLGIAGLAFIFPGIVPRIFRRYAFENIYHAGFWDWISWIILISMTWIFGGLMVTQMVKIFLPLLSTWDTLYITGAWGVSGMLGLLTLFLPSSFGVAELSLTAFLVKLVPFTIAGTIAIGVRIFTLVMEILLSAAFYPFILRYSHDPDPYVTESKQSQT